MIENELYFVKEYNFDNPINQKIDSLTDKSIRDGHHIYFRIFDHICEYDLKFTNINNKESVNFRTSEKNMNLYDLKKKLTVARQNGSIFNQINKLSIIIDSNLSNINIHYHLRLGGPPLHRHFFIKISKNRDYLQTHCDDRRNPFHFACRHWFLYNIPQMIL